MGGSQLRGRCQRVPANLSAHVANNEDEICATTSANRISFLAVQLYDVQKSVWACTENMKSSQGARLAFTNDKRGA